MTIATFQTFIPSVSLFHLFTARLPTRYLVADSMVLAKKIVGAAQEPVTGTNDTHFGSPHVVRVQLANALNVFTGGRLTTLEGEGT
jgi:hypothetical protein